MTHPSPGPPREPTFSSSETPPSAHRSRPAGEVPGRLAVVSSEPASGNRHSKSVTGEARVRRRSHAWLMATSPSQESPRATNELLKFLTQVATDLGSVASRCSLRLDPLNRYHHTFRRNRSGTSHRTRWRTSPQLLQRGRKPELALKSVLKRRRSRPSRGQIAQ